LSPHRHTAPTMTSLTTGNCSSTLCNITIGSLVGRYCILLCELAMCSLLIIVFLWMRSTWILVIRIQNHWQDASNREYLPCPKRNHIYCKCHFNISHFLESYIFICKETRGKFTVHFHIFTHFNCFTRENKFPNIYSNGCKICKSLKYGGKHKQLKWVHIRMMRLPWNIQMYRRTINRSSIKSCLQ